jgi:hypothetical protein
MKFVVSRQERGYRLRHWPNSPFIARRNSAPSFGLSDVRYGSKPDIAVHSCDVRFTPESRHHSTRRRCLLCAKTGLMQRSKEGSLFDHLDDSIKRPPLNSASSARAHNSSKPSSGKALGRYVVTEPLQEGQLVYQQIQDSWSNRGRTWPVIFCLKNCSPINSCSNSRYFR